MRNEASSLETLVANLKELDPEPERIFVDGGSIDDSVALLESLGERVVQIKGSFRGGAMNLGAQLAQADLLVFLHADSYVPQESYRAMVEHVSQGDIEAGAFSHRFQGVKESKRLRAMDWGVALRCKLFRCPYGDQGFFITKSAWEQVGPYEDLPLMEDVEWFGRVKKHLSYLILSECIETSPRRVFKTGCFRTCVTNSTLVLLYKMGVSPEQLAKRYY